MKKFDNSHEHQSCFKSKNSFRFPLTLIIIGLLFLAVNTGTIPTMYQPLFRSWPMWVFFGGLFFLIQGAWFMATALISVGAFFVISMMGAINPALNIPLDFTSRFWPILLVIAGIYAIVAKLCCSSSNCCCGHFSDKNFQMSSYSTEDGVVNIKSGFDSRKHIVMDPIFRGGYVETGFGEVVVDLRKTSLPEGKTFLKVSVSFGSAQIIVPSTWNLQVRGESAFGSFVDARISPSFDPNSNSTLIIDGKCSFGECRIRD